MRGLVNGNEKYARRGVSRDDVGDECWRGKDCRSMNMSLELTLYTLSAVAQRRQQRLQLGIIVVVRFDRL